MSYSHRCILERGNDRVPRRRLRLEPQNIVSGGTTAWRPLQTSTCAKLLCISLDVTTKTCFWAVQHWRLCFSENMRQKWPEQKISITSTHQVIIASPQFSRCEKKVTATDGIGSNTWFVVKHGVSWIKSQTQPPSLTRSTTLWGPSSCWTHWRQEGVDIFGQVGQSN